MDRAGVRVGVGNRLTQATRAAVVVFVTGALHSYAQCRQCGPSSLPSAARLNPCRAGRKDRSDVCCLVQIQSIWGRWCCYLHRWPDAGDGAWSGWAAVVGKCGESGIDHTNLIVISALEDH